tara:strand:- start:4986 stop:5732 length:747 start_codon:yes stop_codon:yes gene_type:complete
MSVLSNLEIKNFQEEGYLVFEGLIPKTHLEHYIEIFNEMVRHAKNLKDHAGPYYLELDKDNTPIAGMLHKVQGVCVADPRLLAMASQIEILDRIEGLVGSNIDVFGTKFFPKLPGGGTSTSWHQDNFYFGTNSSEIISCGIYLQDADEENGCLQVIPGSHSTDQIFEHSPESGRHGSWTNVDTELRKVISVPGGSVVLFSANLLHGAVDNTSSTRTRYSTAWHYIPGNLCLEKFPRETFKDRHTVRGI